MSTLHAAEDALETWRTRATLEESASRASRAARWTAYALGAVLLAAVSISTLLCGLSSSAPSRAQILELAVLTVLYAAAYRLEFEASAGSMVPTQPVLVAMLLTGPLELVPLAVVVAIVLAGIGQSCGEGWYGRAVRVIPAWHSLAPAALLLAFGLRDPSWGDWPILVLALAGQFALDAATAAVRMVSLRVGVIELVRPLSWTFGVDTLMAVVGLGLGLSAQPGWPRVVLAAVPVLLVGVLGRDRRRQVEATISLGAAYDSVSVAATHDVMTGLANRRGWDEALAQAQTRCDAEPGASVCVIVADLDGLKYANDHFGHGTGDALLVRFAAVLTEVAPPGSVAARLGGDEFALLIVSAEPFAGQFVIDRVRTQLRTGEPVNRVPVSASMGWAAYPPEPTLAAAVLAADDAAGIDKRSRKANRRTDPPFLRTEFLPS